MTWCKFLRLRVHLDTAENWKLKLKTEKYCSKIIFKCVNCTVGPIFNEKISQKWNLWIHKQCTICTDWLKKRWEKSNFAATVHAQCMNSSHKSHKRVKKNANIDANMIPKRSLNTSLFLHFFLTTFKVCVYFYILLAKS